MMATAMATAPPSRARIFAIASRIRNGRGGPRVAIDSISFIRASHTTDHAWRGTLCHPALAMTPSCAFVLRQQALGRADQSRRVDAFALHLVHPGSRDRF